MIVRVIVMVDFLPKRCEDAEIKLPYVIAMCHCVWGYKCLTCHKFIKKNPEQG